MNDQDKCHPRYDEHNHIDSGAIDPPPPKPKDNYTADYLAPTKGKPEKRSGK